MKKILFISLLIVGTIYSAYPQKFTVTLRFTALLDFQHVHFDSILVRDLTHPADTMLYWPDSSLTFNFSGVGITEPGKDGGEFGMTLLNPTTEGNARVVVYMPENGPLRFSLFTINGRQQGEFAFSLRKGNHMFDVNTGGEKYVILRAAYQGQIHSQKIIQAGSIPGNKAFVRYSGEYSGELPVKSGSMLSSFPFMPDDSLYIVGYRNGLMSKKYDNPTQSTDYELLFGKNFPCPLATYFFYGGHTYNTVQIGNQCWMKENLNIGTQVTSVYINSTSHSECSDNGIIEKYCYQNLPANCVQYGGLYDWNEAMQYVLTPGTRGICPEGWHIPTDNEWLMMINYLGGEVVAGGHMKEPGFTTWAGPNTGADNTSGFTALGSGHRYHYGNFGYINAYAEFWSSDEYSAWAATFRFLTKDTMAASPYNYFKTYGFSLRCLMDD